MAFECICGPAPRPPRRNSIFGVTKNTIIKFAEMIIEYFILVLMHTCRYYSNITILICLSIVGGYCIVLSGIWISILTDNPFPPRVDMYYSTLAVISHCMLGFYISSTFCLRENIRLILVDSLVFCVSIVFGFDAYFTSKTMMAA